MELKTEELRANDRTAELNRRCLALWARYVETGLLHTDMVLPAMMRVEYGKDGPYSLEQSRTLMAEFESINDAVDAFERDAWFAGLQAVTQECQLRGMSGEAPGLRMLTWVCAGRCLITLEGEGANVTLITSDSEAPYQRPRIEGSLKMGPMGLQSIHATKATALYLIGRACQGWRSLGLTGSETVTIG